MTGDRKMVHKGGSAALYDKSAKKRLNAIKRITGIQQNAEAIRYCISHTYHILNGNIKEDDGV